MVWPKLIKGGGAWWRLLVGQYHIIDEGTNDRLMGQFDEEREVIEVSKKTNIVDTVLHELVHLGQYMTGRYNDEPDENEDTGWEDEASQAVRSILADNAEFVINLTVYIVSKCRDLDRMSKLAFHLSKVSGELYENIARAKTQEDWSE
jgi:hypothetical protein